MKSYTDITNKTDSSYNDLKTDKALEFSESVVIITNIKGIITYVNKKFEDITLYKKNEIIGKPVYTLSSQKQNPEFYKDFWDTLKTGNKWSGAFHSRKKNGEYYWCNSNVFPVKENSQLIGFISIETDMTEEKKLIDINNDLRYQLSEQDKIASLGLLTSGLIHEIYTPLSFIKSNADYLNKKIHQFENISIHDINDCKDVIKDINEGISNIEHLVKELKGYVYDMKPNITIEKFNLIDIINNILFITKNEYKYHSNIELHYDDSIKHDIIGSPSKIKQIFTNLIINSSHAIREKYKDENTMGLISITIIKLAEFYMISFKDNGIGISKNTIPNIFNPLFTTKKKGIGTGLGLSIVKEIIEKNYAGKIQCKSKKNVGTEFKFSIKINNK
ncbi:MAG: PAS domain-containing sensor histidine kinase [Peptostreptococcaceae bacterium]|jgi:PAS domain S-box-containing protein|nr:PAS domain-containing sensor histidine kinase [Peptostreptococcaceae bacterium]